METASSASWPAPAKINLFLHITGRREDGYHLLQTAFQFIDLCDELEIEVRQDDNIRLLVGADGVAEEEDLCWRAARLLQATCDVRQGVDLRIRKRIPMGAGLGGGSSDAATTLVALNRLWGCGLDQDRLARLGLQLGADVPVFIYGHAAWAEGVGEELQPISPETPWYLLVCPACAVATAEIFSAPELTRDCQSMTMAGFLAGAGGNVCEAVVRQRFRAVDEALVTLSRWGRARMTGTGASVFVAMPDRATAEQARRALPGDWQAHVVHGMNLSPLLARLEGAGRTRS